MDFRRMMLVPGGKQTSLQGGGSHKMEGVTGATMSCNMGLLKKTLTEMGLLRNLNNPHLSLGVAMVTGN